MSMLGRLTVVLLSLSVPAVHGALLVYTDLAKWQAAVGAFETDDFSSAPRFSQSPYASATGVTLNRAGTRLDDAGESQAISVDYTGNLYVNRPPSYYESFNRINTYQSGSTHVFAGVEDRFQSYNGWRYAETERLSDGARRADLSIDNRTTQSTAYITGSTSGEVFGLGFSVQTGAVGPKPGSLEMIIDGQAVSALLNSFGPGAFFGIVSTERISTFRLNAIAGEPVASVDAFVNRSCFPSPGEVCLQTGVSQIIQSYAQADFTSLFVASGVSSGLLSSNGNPAAASTPEPSAVVLVAGGAAALAILRRRIRAA
ncbi:MAG TPA: PEP-CTERM sorting domain-containing protein [Bryobacteraceae bacterium]|nr:PEP-CTERM sorting domain-containing protein [Bryobacteraceae bacterium]